MIGGCGTKAHTPIPVSQHHAGLAPPGTPTQSPPPLPATLPLPLGLPRSLTGQGPRHHDLVPHPHVAGRHPGRQRAQHHGAGQRGLGRDALRGGHHGQRKHRLQVGGEGGRGGAVWVEQRGPDGGGIPTYSLPANHAATPCGCSHCRTPLPAGVILIAPCRRPWESLLLTDPGPPCPPARRPGATARPHPHPHPFRPVPPQLHPR